MKVLWISCFVAMLFCGCAPKIISSKSPINNLTQDKCFAFPSKEYLGNQPIYQQKLYQLTENSLRKNNIEVFYGHKCKNYLFTDWVVSSQKELVQTNEVTFTNNYGNIYSNSYNKAMPYTYSSSSYSYTIPASTYETTKYYGRYTVRVGTIENSKLTIVWEGSQGGAVSNESASSVEDQDQPIVDAMIKTMIKSVYEQ